MPTTCVICDVPLTPLDDATSPTCGRHECRWRFETTPATERCAVCAKPLTFVQRAAGVCASLECHRVHFIARHRETDRKRRAELSARALTLRAASAETLGIDASAYPISLTPSIDRPLTPLPAERRAAIERHIETIIAQAIERGPANAPIRDPRDEAALEPPSAELGAVFGSACATCRGSCCRNGGERGYLSAETLQRRMLAHPESSADAMRAEYVSHVGMLTIEASCVFHGAMGCTLPRDLRSDTCNRFYCGALHELERAVPVGLPIRAFVVAVDVDAIEGAAFIDAAERRVTFEGRTNAV